MHFKKHIYPLFIITCFTVISLSLFLFCYQATPWAENTSSTAFQTFTHDLFVSEVTKDTLTLHYTLNDPTKYGIKSTPITLPLMKPGNTVTQALSLENLLTFLDGVNYSTLTTADQYTYDILYDYFSHELAGVTYSYFPEPFSPSHGIQSSFPILMAEYSFTSEADIQHYLALLAQTSLYFQSFTSWEELRAQKGYAMADYSMDKVITQCDSIITRDSLLCGTHFLQSSFSNRCAKLVEMGLLTSAAMSSYEKANSNMLVTYVLPAYEELGLFFTNLKGSGTNENGVAHLSCGKDYYCWLLQKNTGSSRSIEDIFQLLQDDYQEKSKRLSELIDVFKENPDNKDISTSTFALSTADEMVTHLSTMCQDLFPPFPNRNYVTGSASPICKKSKPSVTIKNVDSALENYTSPAFYMIPPIDNATSNSIYINQKNAPGGIELYTTLAHEGYPGHLYQTVYYALYQKEQGIDPIRNALHFGGYVEGFAIYSESLAYDYASTLMEETYDTSSYGDYYEILKLSRQSELCLLSILDVCIHYYGITYPQIANTLATYGVTDETQTRSIYEYIVEEPTNYLKYYLGYLEILDLKEEYTQKCGKSGISGSKSSSESSLSKVEYGFHKFLLECGPSDFGNLQKQLEKQLR